jgi:ParB-like chromosome segregation protein Spo0J
MAHKEKPPAILSDAIKTESWPLEKILPYHGNPRRRSKKAVEKVANSIKAFGWRQPIVVDEKGVILVGHTRREAAEMLKLATAPVHQALGLTAAQKKAYRIADNRLNEETAWDENLLGVELEELKGMGFDLTLTGFKLTDVGSYTRGIGAEPEQAVADKDSITTIRLTARQTKLLCRMLEAQKKDTADGIQAEKILKKLRNRKNTL